MRALDNGMVENCSLEEAQIENFIFEPYPKP